jgi:hypothetical protein
MTLMNARAGIVRTARYVVLSIRAERMAQREHRAYR